MSTIVRPVQLAYFVDDVRAAAQAVATLWGAGPFFVLDRIELAWGEHRGRPCHFVHSSAYGQWGEMMIELVQQDEEGPSPFRDVFAPGEQGLHHVAGFVEDLDEALAAYARSGFEIAARAETKRGGSTFAFVDTVPERGHMVEVYERTEALAGFYAFVRQAAVDWDGTDPVRLA